MLPPALKFAGLILASALAVCLVLHMRSPSAYPSYDQYKLQFGKSYPKHEDAFRRVNYEKTVELITMHNAKAPSARMGINQFSDLTDDEFVQKHLGRIVTKELNSLDKALTDSVAIEIDWVGKGAVSPVRNQGACPATYAFSSVGAAESLSAIAYKNPTSLSVQQILDCSSGFDNQGCTAGSVERTFDYIRERGLNNESAYPYKGQVQACTSMYGKFKISSWVAVTGCNNLLNALAGRPVSVLVDASNWRTYSYGVFSNCTDQVNLAALLVGATDAYWRVKNSWGVSWGENGYIRLDRNNGCGICKQASYPVA